MVEFAWGVPENSYVWIATSDYRWLTNNWSRSHAYEILKQERRGWPLSRICGRRMILAAQCARGLHTCLNYNVFEVGLVAEFRAEGVRKGPWVPHRCLGPRSPFGFLGFRLSVTPPLSSVLSQATVTRTWCNLQSSLFKSLSEGKDDWLRQRKRHFGSSSHFTYSWSWCPAFANQSNYVEQISTSPYSPQAFPSNKLIHKIRFDLLKHSFSLFWFTPIWVF